MKNIPTPSAPDRDLDSLLIAAARNSSGEVVDKNGITQTVAGLLYQGANVNAVASDGSSALMIAARKGHIEIASTLLKWDGINVNLVGPYDETALMIAARKGHTEIVLALLNCDGIDVNAERFNRRTGLNHSTALTLAAQFGHGEIVSALLSCDGINITGMALWSAAENGQTEIVSILLAHDGIDVNAATILGDTALTFAAENGHAETVLALLSRRGVNWQMVQNQLSNPLLPILQNLNEEVSVLLAVVLPSAEPRDTIITRFNQGNPNNAIQQQGNDIIGAGLQAYNDLIDLRSWHVRYLTDSGVSEDEAKNSANQRFRDLLNNKEKRREALARKNLVTELVTNLESLALDFEREARGFEPADQTALDALRSLNPEDLYKLKTKIIDNSKEVEGEKVKDKKAEAQGIPTLKVLSFAASLPSTSPATAISSTEPRTQQIDDPQDQTSPAAVVSGIDSRPQQIVGTMGGRCTVS